MLVFLLFPYFLALGVEDGLEEDEEVEKEVVDSKEVDEEVKQENLVDTDSLCNLTTAGRRCSYNPSPQSAAGRSGEKARSEMDVGFFHFW